MTGANPVTCRTCRYWGQDQRFAHMGTCRIRAPALRTGTDRGEWPVTEQDDWCGEHVTSDDATKQAERMAALQAKVDAWQAMNDRNLLLPILDAKSILKGIPSAAELSYDDLMAIDAAQPEPRIPHHGEDLCHDCDAKPGEMHMPGCDAERCATCGGQWIQCGGCDG